MTLSHAHIKDGYKQPGRDGPWSSLFSGAPRHWRAFGLGWEHCTAYNPEIMPGPIPGGEIFDELAMTLCGPQLPPWNTGWPITAKAREYAWCGACMLPHDGPTFRYDPEFKIWPENHPCRVRTRADVAALVGSSFDFEAEAERVELLTRPHFREFDAALDTVLSGGRYGGYTCESS